MHYYQHHIGDYRKKTAHLTNEEDLCYRRILEMYYDFGGPLANDKPTLSRRLRVAIEVLENVLNDFFFLVDDKWHNARCDAEINKYTSFLEKNKENGRKGGNAKALKTKKKTIQASDGLATAKQPPSDGLGLGYLTTNHKPLTTNHKPRIKSPIPPFQGGESLPDSDFEKFWNEYPKRVAKAPTLRAWQKLRPSAELKTEIFRSIEIFRTCEQWSSEGGRFIPNPATWLNQRRWEDEPPKQALPFKGAERYMDCFLSEDDFKKPKIDDDKNIFLTEDDYAKP